MALSIDIPTEKLTTIDVKDETEIQFAFNLELDQVSVHGQSLVVTVDGKQIILSNFFAADGSSHVDNFILPAQGLEGSEGADVVNVADFVSMIMQNSSPDNNDEMETASDRAPGNNGFDQVDNTPGNLFDPNARIDREGDFGGNQPQGPETAEAQPPVIPTATTVPLTVAPPTPVPAPEPEIVPGRVLEYTVDGEWGRDTAYNAGSAGVGATGDRLYKKGMNETFEEYVGGDGKDTLSMTDGNDVLQLQDDIGFPADGQARIESIEVVEAGDGKDLIDLTSPDLLYGDVAVYGQGGNDVIWTNAGNDILDGGDGNDKLVGGLGDDTFYGGAGRNLMKGGGGDDLIYGGDSTDYVYDGAGSDTVYLGAGNDKVYVAAGYHDEVTLGDGSDKVIINRASLSEGDLNSLVSIIDFNPGEDELDLSGFTVLQTEYSEVNDYTALFVADDLSGTNSTWVMLHGVDNTELSSVVAEANMASVDAPIPDAAEFLQQHLQETDLF